MLALNLSDAGECGMDVVEFRASSGGSVKLVAEVPFVIGRLISDRS